MKIILDNMLRIQTQGPREIHVLQFVKEQLTFDNPEYINAIKMGIWITPELRARQYIRAWSVEDDGSIITPRAFWHKLRTLANKEKIKYTIEDKRITRTSRKKFKYKDDFKLRPYQEAAVQRAMDIGEGMIIAPCGSGKTQILTDIIKRHNEWTLVLVHTDDLLQQMKTRLEKSLGIKVGIVKQNLFDIQPVTVASIATLYRRGDDIVPEELQNASGGFKIIEPIPNKGGPRKAAIWRAETFYKLWGMVLLDEAHHSPANSIYSVVNRFHAKYRLGCTATERRRDNLEGMMFATMGYRIFNITHRELYDAGYLMPADVFPIETSFHFPYYNPRQYGKLLTALVENNERNLLIVDNIYKEPKQFHLILSNRIDHLRRMYELLMSKDRAKLYKQAKILIGELDGESREQIISGMKKGTIRYIFATQLADEGLDIPNLSRVHLTFPTRAENKVIQQCGRVQRPSPGKKTARVYDYVDSAMSVLSNQAEERVRIYHLAEYNIHETRRNENRKAVTPNVWHPNR